MNYQRYRFSWLEIIKEIGIGLLALGLIVYCFYDSWIAYIVFMPLLLPYMIIRNSIYKKKRLSYLRIQFKDMINAMAAAVNTGYSIENALVESASEMRKLYGGKADIVCECEYMQRQIKTTTSIEDAFLEFANRCGIEEIIMYATVFSIGKRNGSSLAAIITRTTSAISQRIDMDNQIKTLLSSRRYELLIMAIMPIVIILYIRFSSKGFLDNIYNTYFGIIIMTGCLIMYAVAVLVGKRIMEVKL